MVNIHFFKEEKRLLWSFGKLDISLAYLKTLSKALWRSKKVFKWIISIIGINKSEIFIKVKIILQLTVNIENIGQLVPGIVSSKYIGGPTERLRPKRSVILHWTGSNWLASTNEKSKSPLGSMRIRGANKGLFAIEICDDWTIQS